MAKATAKRKVIVESGEAHISATFNNIIISLTNKGEVISWSSAGKMGLEVLKEHSIRSPNGSRRL
jgi:small subunit ribosomal protein S11